VTKMNVTRRYGPTPRAFESYFLPLPTPCKTADARAMSIDDWRANMPLSSDSDDDGDDEPQRAKRARADTDGDPGVAGPLDPAKLVVQPPGAVNTGAVNKRFQCEQCWKSVATAGSLARHLKTHVSDKPHHCSECSYKCKRTDQLRAHMLRHSEERPLACNWPDCLVTVKRSSELVVHIRREHTHEKPYVCTYNDCSFAFPCKNDLVRHFDTHTKTKRHFCSFDLCSKGFSRAKDLQYHENIHKGEKPYVCSFEGCLKAFAQPSPLVGHLRTHTGERPYSCSVCDATFTQSSPLHYHMARYHYEEYVARRKQQESIVEDLLAPAFPLNTFVREHRIDNTCLGPDLLGDAKKYARADFLFPYTLRHDTCVMLEVDEHGHEDYIVKCETARMYNQVETLRAEGNTQKFVFVRYNPHAFKVDGVTLRTGREERHKELLRTLRAIADGPADVPDVRVIYLFYDRNAAGRPDVLDDPDYDETVASWWCQGV